VRVLSYEGAPVPVAPANVVCGTDCILMDESLGRWIWEFGIIVVPGTMR
jgi:hypothetical protein